MERKERKLYRLKRWGDGGKGRGDWEAEEKIREKGRQV